jgi:hypothetical protein
MDDLNMAWDIDVDDRHIEPSLQNHNKEAFSHIMRNSQSRYCVRYGSADLIVSEGRPSQHTHTLHGGQSTFCVGAEGL